MPHVRQQIRDNIETTLTGLATTGGNIYRSRVYPIAEDKLPGILIYTESEEVDTATITPPRTQVRSLVVKVEVYVKGVSNFDDDVDTIGAELEAALTVDVTRGGIAKDTTILSFDADYAGDGEQPVAVGRYSVRVDYVTLENNANVAV